MSLEQDGSVIDAAAEGVPVGLRAAARASDTCVRVSAKQKKKTGERIDCMDEDFCVCGKEEGAHRQVIGPGRARAERSASAAD
jgi:hypothetical protein